jgi:hypothetical protein
MNKPDYKALFNRYAKTQFGKEQNLEAIEAKLGHLRKGASLTYEDLGTIANPLYWPFSKYWLWPHRAQIEDKLKRTEGWFAQLPGAEQKVVRGLNDIFKNIALVSIVLRFARPDLYAIYSAPTLRALRIERGVNEVAEYLNYVQEMRILQNCFGTDKLAEVDMIVWAIAHDQGEYLTELKRILSKVLPENLTPEELLIYFSDNPLKMAEIYLNSDFKTAGFWAAKAFEYFLDNECRRHEINVPERANKRADMINKLCCSTGIWRPRFNSGVLDRARIIRNRIVPGVKQFTRKDVEDFIAVLKQLYFIAGQKRI